MDLNYLRAFVAVAEEESFSLAGERLHLTQPAISKRIATLESELGVRLFDRIGRNVHLTEAGRQLLPKARGMLAEMADLRRTLSNLREEVAGTLSMATSHHIGLHRLPPVLGYYRRHYPEVQLDIRFMDSESACNAVAQGQLELGIVTLPTQPPAQLELVPLWDDPLYFVVCSNHPLAMAERISLEDLTEQPAVLPGIGTYTREILEQALRPRGVAIRTELSTNYLETLKMLVSVGLGWSLLPGTLLQDGELRVLPITELALSRRLGAVHHRGRTLSNAARVMLDACETFAGKGPSIEMHD